MKRNFVPLILLVSTILALSSCLGDDETEIVYSDEAGITAFSLGTQKIVRDTVTSKGADSTYQTTLDCSSYVFYIDQVKHEIYNPDSLPVGIDAKKIICEVTSKSSSITLLKNVDSDTLQNFNSSDSIDFSTPRTFRMLSMSGRATCDYTVKVNIHTQKPNVFEWKEATPCLPMAQLTAMRALTMGGKVYVVGSDGMETHLFVAGEDHVVAWNEIQTNITLDADAYKSMTAMGAWLFTCAADGTVYRSADGATWTSVGTTSLRQLVGASPKHLYGISTDNQLMASVDGATWAAETLDTPADSLPTANYAIVTRALLSNPGVNTLVLVGTSGTTSKVWTKIEEANNEGETQPWTYTEVASDNRFRLPNMTNMQAVLYDGCIMALGGRGMGDSHTPAYEGLYASVDGGMTWRLRSIYNMPVGFDMNTNRFALVADAHNYLWLIDSRGFVWRGRLNRLGWETDRTYFDEDKLYNNR